MSDRSADGTADDRSARLRREDPRARVIEVTSLPERWLGKSHACHAGAAAAAGDWLLFTDADCRLSPDVIARALRVAARERADHVALTPDPSRRRSGLRLALRLRRQRRRLVRAPPTVTARTATSASAPSTWCEPRRIAPAAATRRCGSRSSTTCGCRCWSGAPAADARIFLGAGDVLLPLGDDARRRAPPDREELLRRGELPRAVAVGVAVFIALLFGTPLAGLASGTWLGPGVRPVRRACSASRRASGAPRVGWSPAVGAAGALLLPAAHVRDGALDGPDAAPRRRPLARHVLSDCDAARRRRPLTASADRGRRRARAHVDRHRIDALRMRLEPTREIVRCNDVTYCGRCRPAPLPPPAQACSTVRARGAQQAAPPAPATPPAPRGLPVIRIKDVQTILTAPNRIRLVVVKVVTDQPGLYGLGCATFTQRALVVQTAIDQYLKPFLIGNAASTRSRTSGSRPTSAPTGATAPCSSTRSAASTWRCGTSSASAPACRSTSSSAASAARRRLLLPRQRTRLPGGRGQRPQGDRAGLPLRPRAGRRARPGHLRRRAHRRGRPTPPRPDRADRPDGAARGVGIGALRAHGAEAVRAPAHASSATRSSCCTTCTSASS